MKMKLEDFEILRKAIVPLDTPSRRLQYEEGKFDRSHLVKDLSKRYRWDLFWLSRAGLNFCQDLNDVHIDTALRAIVEDL